jgi:hypothetical protein
MNRIVIIILLLFLSSCGDDCSEYSDFSCDEIRKATYNTYFYYPSGTEEYLGIADGLDQCGNMAIWHTVLRLQKIYQAIGNGVTFAA